MKTLVATPNDPKLSDGGGWRAGCGVGERRRQEAAGVTAARVRCSAWLGVAVIWLKRLRKRGLVTHAREYGERLREPSST